ncbi:MAG: GTPase HflX [Chthoniobacterales bacterium]|nr:GTPase HflX [Chthoniobacterales bacterium]
MRKLPHQLIEAFNATLEEAALADFLIHVLDASQDEVMAFYNTTMNVLGKLGAETKQMLVVFNKVDKVTDPHTLPALRRHFPDALFVSVQTGEGMEQLVDRISDFVARGTVTVELRLPPDRADLLARLHREGSVRDLVYDGEFTEVVATMPARLLEIYSPYLRQPAPELVPTTPE